MRFWTLALLVLAKRKQQRPGLGGKDVVDLAGQGGLVVAKYMIELLGVMLDAERQLDGLVSG